MALKEPSKYHSAPASFFLFGEIQAWARLKILPCPLVFFIHFKYRSAPARFFLFKVKMDLIFGVIRD
jgi:hypothetical protein